MSFAWKPCQARQTPIDSRSNMEIRDPIHGTVTVASGEVSVLDSAPFQRLRQIKQLGFAEFSFPGAVHNRYIHSLGVMHLAGIAFDNIFRGYEFSARDV